MLYESINFILALILYSTITDKVHYASVLHRPRSYKTSLTPLIAVRLADILMLHPAVAKKNENCKRL